MASSNVVLAATPPPPYYAVVFTSLRSENDPRGYALTADRMVELAREQPGFLGVESVREAGGLGITVSYWRDLPSISAWKAVAEHRVAQQNGRDKWYRTFATRVAKVERDYSFDITTGHRGAHPTPNGHLPHDAKL